MTQVTDGNRVIKIKDVVSVKSITIVFLHLLVFHLLARVCLSCSAISSLGHRIYGLKGADLFEYSLIIK